MKLKKNRYVFVFFGAALGFLGCSSHTAPSTVASQPTTTNSVPAGKTESPAKAPTVTPFYEAEGNTLAASEETEEENVSESDSVIGEEVEKEITESHALSETEFDIPMILNHQVEKWIDYYQNRGRKVFANWLSRSGKYIPMMQRILKENGLPKDLVYLSMIESGFKPYAYSHAKASGPWQFIHGTGSRYGLRNDYWIDERRDPEKSTLAAAQHLKDLYDQFKHWYLVAAGYNAGAGKVSRAIEKYSTEDFWEMSQYSYLKPETKNYVPKMLAAALVAKNPEKFGFNDVVYDDPETYTKVSVNGPTQLSLVAQFLGIPVEQLKTLNPELKRGTTPPNTDSYELKIPQGMDVKFASVYPEIQKKSTEVQTAQHVVRKGESLKSIARAYGVSSGYLAKTNALKSKSVRRGQILTVHYKPHAINANTPSEEFSPTFSARESRKSRNLEYGKASSNALSSYRVKRGDTLWSISRKFNCSVSDIKKWNSLRDASEIKHGRVLRVMKRGSLGISTKYKSEHTGLSSTPAYKSHTIKRGEDLFSISKRYKMSVRELSKLNGLSPQEKIRPGKTLIIRSVRL